ncbi:hypothetical protein D3C86_1847280 [compost metagenome]
MRRAGWLSWKKKSLSTSAAFSTGICRKRIRSRISCEMFWSRNTVSKMADSRSMVLSSERVRLPCGAFFLMLGR